MVERLLKYIESNRLFSPNDTLLVGVSGGIDSVVLIDLLNRAGLAFAVAHCNFQLRGTESGQDEHFVKELSESYGKLCFCKSFDTREYANEKGISIEMAARDLRYDWFEEVRRTHHFDWILVAHHLDDQIETFFLNLVRGTGISGLTGMKIVNGKVVRPLLFCSRKEIENYAAANRLHYREDSSNALTDFQRNKIRKMVLPLLEELNPSFRESMEETIGHLRETSAIYLQSIERARELCVRKKSNGETEILLDELRLLNPLSTYLFELLKPFHFNGEVVEEMVKAMEGQAGKQFYSQSHRAVLDRQVIIIAKLAKESITRFYLDETLSVIDVPIKLTFSTTKQTGPFQWNTSPMIASLDKDLLQFPLILRKWQKGDYFQPLGMKGMKKLSDFFVDEKFSLPEKEECWILANGEEIVWIVGVRVDNRYKITPKTRNILVVKLN
ncbi:MAG: tRNA lysidine(34) synthetase TilS [Prolixibacteraceae bacterium]|jgi:tRNA(Ile)-lysidine synthase|nr:tRNA lysidine(34) synthetase TilS [Prolixibacteraceae bacterium]